jgi:hypothetical protein
MLRGQRGPDPLSGPEGASPHDRQPPTGEALWQDALGDPGVLRALVESGASLALLALFGLGIGAIIRHSAGAIATFVGCTLLLPAHLHPVAGNPSRFTPQMIYANSVAVAVPNGAALLVRRDA